MMQFAQPVRMADDPGGPVWARSRRRARGGGFLGGLIGLIVTLLTLFGALTAVLSIKEHSVARGGAMIDGWIAAGWGQVQQAMGKAPEAAVVAADRAGDVASDTGQALKDGAEKAADPIKPAQ